MPSAISTRHQKHERSHMVNGNQIPMCARDVGILAGLLLGAVIFGRRGNNRWTSTDTILSILPESLLIHVSNESSSSRSHHAGCHHVDPSGVGWIHPTP